MKLKGNYFKE